MSRFKNNVLLSCHEINDVITNGEVIAPVQHDFRGDTFLVFYAFLVDDKFYSIDQGSHTQTTPRAK